MADSLSPNIYSGGAVVFNSQPYTQFYLNSMSKKRAKEEALDNYFRDFHKSINPAGMRPQDIENGWMQKVNGWQEYYQKNRQFIQNPKLDNGKAYNQYMSMHTDLLVDTEKSKSEGKKNTDYLLPIMTNPDKASRLTNNSRNAMYAHDLPIYDPNHKSLDPSVFEYDYKPFDIASANKLDIMAKRGAKMSSTIQKVSIDPKTKNKIVSYESAFNPDDLRTIAGKYVDAYNTDGSFQNAIHDMRHDPNTYEEYNKKFKSLYGQDIATDEDMAGAYGLSRIQDKVSTQKASTYSPFTPYDFEALREKYFDYTQDGKQAEANSAIDEMADRQVSQAKQEINDPWSAGKEGAGYLPTDPATLKSLNVEALKYDPNRGIVPIWHQKNKDAQGNEETVEVEGTPMGIDDYKAALGKRNVGSKYFMKKGKDEDQKTTIHGGSKTTKKSDPLGLF